jgi:putative ABC transport system ATP-binding protein
MNKTKIELYNVEKTKNQIKILKDINLRFNSGKIHNLIGHSGAGKTTLLRLLNRMDEPSSGRIEYDGKDIKDIPVLELRRRIGMVFQIPVMFDGTVKNNLSIPYSLRTNSNHVNEEDLINALELAGLQNDFLERRASELSVGEKQRLTVARALINKPDVLLLDEPTSALDHFTGIKLLESIKELNEALGLTIIMVTHQLEYARILGGRVINLVNGTIVRVEEVEDYFLNSEII